MSRGMRPGWRHFVQAIAAGTTLLIVTGGLTGCDGKEPEPTATTTHAVTAKPTPSPTPTPTPTLAPEPITPTAPAALTDVGADGATKEEAIQVAEYFLALYSYVGATNDLSAWDKLSGPECTFCAAVADDVRRQVSNGQSIRGGELHPSEVVVTESDPGRLYLVEGISTQDDITVYGEDGKKIASQQGSTNTFHMAVMYEGGAWIIAANGFS